MISKTKLREERVCDGCRLIIMKGDNVLSRPTNFRGVVCKVYFHNKKCEKTYEENKNVFKN